jgi:hypothetical protein
MDRVNQINRTVLELWQDEFSSDEDVFMPLIYPAIEKGKLLFIGLNPSFSQKGFRSILKDSPYSYIKPNNYYHWHNRKEFDPEIAKEIEKLAKRNHSYFNNFWKISDSVKMEWEHIDLFFYRQTKQKDFITRIYTDKVLNSFGKNQLNLSKKLITEANPKVIVVANAHASKMINDEFNATFNEDTGYHNIHLNGKSIPLFLTSMFTYMDTFSRKRLIWHIKKGIEQSR